MTSGEAMGSHLIAHVLLHRFAPDSPQRGNKGLEERDERNRRSANASLGAHTGWGQGSAWLTWCRPSPQRRQPRWRPFFLPAALSAFCRRFCSSSQDCSGAKYSSIGLADISRLPVNACSASGHGLRGAHRQHLISAARRLPCCRKSCSGEAALPARHVAGRLVELELQDASQEIAGVGRVARNVELGARIEVRFRARDRGSDTLILLSSGRPRPGCSLRRRDRRRRTRPSAICRPSGRTEGRRPCPSPDEAAGRCPCWAPAPFAGRASRSAPDIAA